MATDRQSLRTFASEVSARAIITLVMLVILLGTIITTIRTIHAYILIPGCSLPFLVSTQFCVAVKSLNNVIVNPIPNDVSRTSSWISSSRVHISNSFCKIPGISLAGICRDPALQSDSVPQAAKLIREQFNTLAGIYELSTDIPAVTFEFREIAMVVRDLQVGVKIANMINRDALAAELETVAAGTIACSNSVQTFDARLDFVQTMYVLPYARPYEDAKDCVAWQNTSKSE